MEVPTRQRLTAEDWIAAALRALAHGGIAAVAVEPLAAAMGATKGSFYWHFATRDALLTAALRHWERVETEEVIAEVERSPAGAARLRLLLSMALGSGRVPSSGARVELALQSTAAHPLVAPVLERVTGRRLGYLSAQFAELGFDPDDARRRGLLAYTAYLGHAQLAHATPAVVPGPGDLPAYIDTVITTLTA